MGVSQVFIALWAPVVFLQVLKLYHALPQELGISPHVVFVASGALLTVAAPLTRRRIAHCMMLLWHLGSLLMYGSRSNHVIIAACVCLLMLPQYFVQNASWTTTRNMVKLFLSALYLVTAYHKLNYGWFDARYSCASLYTAVLLSMFDLSRWRYSPLILLAAPYLAIVVELLLGFYMLAVLVRPTLNKWMVPVAAVASGFHLTVAFAVPPFSVYPLSIIMTPLYYILVQEDDSRVSFPWLLICSCFYAVLFGFAYPDQYEYPAYHAWPIFSGWQIASWSTVFDLGANGAPANLEEGSNAFRSLKGLRPQSIKFPKLIQLSAGLLAPALMFAIGMMPYFGWATYPALAMFSNLRVEGKEPNHLLSFLGSSDRVSDTIRVLDTNIEGLRHYQFDLGKKADSTILAGLKELNVSSELWICPPAPLGGPDTFVPFDLTRNEFNRVLCQAAFRAKDNHFFVKVIDGKNDIHIRQGPELGVICTDDGLNPRPYFTFRASDDVYSPCRH